MRCIDILTETLLQIYRGEGSHNRGGSYYTQDRDFARQFTQSGRDQEIKVRWIRSEDIYRPPSPVSAAAPTREKEQAWENAIDEARQLGFKAVQFDEGAGEPPSIFVFDRTALRLRPAAA